MNGVQAATVSGNTIDGVVVRQSFRAAIYLFDCHGNVVHENGLSDALGDGFGTAGIRLRAGSSGNLVVDNDLTSSGIAGLPDLPVCVFLDGNTTGNLVKQSGQFPASTNAVTQATLPSPAT